ncbi:anti-sigma-D factor RsdA [Nocardia shimofusensis]|uniref:anti-sigma-D factor RsdA n=1 Tax=Nocardia shimofusensis TaxID=228596 RepID=UPI000B16FA55|nr:anti-sigma-D factor RsdA [Nocardia shimofusensis]
MARDGERGRGDWKARRGSRNSGPYAGDAGDAGPVDIAAVRRDDALIDAIVSGGPVQTDSAEEFQLAALLADWRTELIDPPMPSAPDLDAVVAAVNQEIGARKVRVGAQARGKLRLLYPITGAAAALALIIGGTTAFSYSAEPGDPLWRVKEVVFSEQAQTTVVQRADNELSQAEQALEQGNYSQAAALLERAQTNVGQVSDNSKKQELERAWQVLLTDLREKSPELATQLEQTVQPSTVPRPGTTVTVDPTTGNTVTMLPPNQGTTDPVNPTQAVEPSDTPDATLDPTDPAEPSTQPPTEPPATNPATTPLPPTTAPSNGGGLPSDIIPTLPSAGIPLPTEIPTQLLPPGMLSPGPTT